MSDEQMTLRLIASVLQDVSKRLEDHQTARLDEHLQTSGGG